MTNFRIDVKLRYGIYALNMENGQMTIKAKLSDGKEGLVWPRKIRRPHVSSKALRLPVSRSRVTICSTSPAWFTKPRSASSDIPAQMWRITLAGRRQAGKDIPKSHSKFFYQIAYTDRANQEYIAEINKYNSSISISDLNIEKMLPVKLNKLNHNSETFSRNIWRIDSFFESIR